jgi:hypothetical protein
MAQPLVTLFSWGYWGWGSVTEQLVRAVDAVEAARGFEPPIFADIRYSRSVRAAGFREKAFEKLLGQDRYRWLRTLGNRGIENGTLEIDVPESAPELLQLAVDAHERKQRVLFFCGCRYPAPPDRPPCHRVEVARLVGKEAQRSGCSLQIIEWPGGEPTMENPVEVAPSLLADVRNGRANVPVSGETDIAHIAGLPWGSHVQLHAGDESFQILSGPANYAGGHWQIPVTVRDEFHDEGVDIEDAMHDFRRARGYEARLFGPSDARRREEARPVKRARRRASA